MKLHAPSKAGSQSKEASGIYRFNRGAARPLVLRPRLTTRAVRPLQQGHAVEDGHTLQVAVGDGVFGVFFLRSLEKPIVRFPVVYDD